MGVVGSREPYGMFPAQGQQKSRIHSCGYRPMNTTRPALSDMLFNIALSLVRTKFRLLQ